MRSATAIRTRLTSHASRITLCIFLLSYATDAFAADLSVAARLDRTRLEVGASADLALEINGAQNVSAPALSAPDGLSVRYVGPSTQVSIVNGQMSASITHHYSLTAAKAGTFTIGPITVEHEGRRYDAGKVTLEVAGAASGAGGGRVAAPARDRLQLTLSMPKSEVYLNERVPVNVQLAVGNVRVSDLQYPTVAGDGFALEPFPEPLQRQEQTTRGVFRMIEFRTMLTPLRSGSLTVGPAKMGLNVVVPQRGLDPLLSRFFSQREPVEQQSEALALNVQPLPEEGKPADFSGAVGHFQFEVSAAPLDLQAGDPVTLTMKIRGSGGLENVTSPAIAGGDLWRVYPAQPQPAANPQEKVFEQVVIPQQPGSVTLPDLRFSYFDPDARAYRTLVHAPIALTVREPPHNAPQIVGGAPAFQTVPEALGRDIVFIKDTPGDWRSLGQRRYQSVLFWLYQPLPLAGWLAAVFYDRRRRRLSGDVRYARFTRAGRHAREAIGGARLALRNGKRQEFYDAVARAVSDYLSAKLDLPPGSVTADRVGERLRECGLSSHVADDVQRFFDACEQIRFAPSAAGDGDMQRTLERADAIIATLERERRLGAVVSAALLVVVSASLATWCWAAAGGESPNTLFFRANSLYTEERYADAAAEYEKILAAGRESGNLYFNLGNAYFKTGDTGDAILNYERARRMMPRDPDLHANLGYARTLSGDDHALPVYARLLFPLADRMASDELLPAASIAYTALMILLALGRLVPATERIASGAAIAAAIALVLTVTSAAYRLATVDLPDYAVVTAREETTVRFEPSSNGTPHYGSKPGAVLRVLAEREGWAQVARPDGKRGWIELAAFTKL